jgi:peroxiredoxin
VEASKTRKYLLASLIVNIILIGTITWVFLTLSPLSRKPQVIGGASPDFALQSLDNKIIKLSDLRDKTVVVYTWLLAPPCRNNMLQLQKTYDKLPKDKFEIVAVTLKGQDINQVKNFAAKSRISFPIIMDEDDKVFKELREPQTAPYLFIINRSGILEFVKFGAFADENELNSIIQSVANPGSTP